MTIDMWNTAMKTRKGRNDSDSRRPTAAGRVAAAALLLTLGVFAAGRSQAKPPTPKAVAAVLAELRAELEWPGLTVEQAAKHLKTPAEALRFVRDEVVLVNYRGSYAGPEAVLRTRVANASDKSALLAALLGKMGVEARLARANWPKAAEPHQGPGPRRPLPALKRLAALFGPAGAVNDTPTSVSDKQLKQLRDEIAASAKAVTGLLTAKRRLDLLTGVPDAGDVEPTRTDIDWVWVQSKLDGKTWTDMDVVFPKLPRPQRYFKPFMPKPVTMSIRLEAGRNGKEDVKEVLQWSGPCRDVLGYDIVLNYVPATKRIQAAEHPENVGHWRPFLSAGPLKAVGEPFTPAGGRAKPPAGQVSYDFLRLVVEFNDPGGLRPWSASYGRIVQYVGAGYDPHELIAFHRIGLAVAFVPPRVAGARMVDEVLDVHRLRLRTGQPDAARAPAARGYSTRTIRTLNSLLFLKLLATPTDLDLGWKGPALFVETCQLRKVKGRSFFAARLDTLHESFGPQADQTRRQRMLWGLATCAVEARLLKARSVNQNLLAAIKSLRLIDKSGKPTTGRVDAAALQRSVLAEGGVVLAGAGAPQSAWAIRPTGELLGVFADGGSGLEAKGGGRLTPSEGGRGFGAFSSGAMATLGYPPGMLVTPLTQYFDELARAYGGATAVLIKLAKTIETGDMRYMLDNRGDYFRNLDRHLMNALTRGFVRGWAEAATGAGIGRVLGTTASDRIIHKIMDGLVAGGLSMPEEFPILPGLLELAMDAVTIPMR